MATFPQQEPAMGSQTELFSSDIDRLSDKLAAWTGRRPPLRGQMDGSDEVRGHIEATLEREAKMIPEMAGQIGLKLGRMSPLGQLTVLGTAAGALIATVARDKAEADRMFQAFQANAARQLAAQLKVARKR
jgi:hypothetical protein